MGFGNNTGRFTYVHIKEGKLVIKKGDQVQSFNYFEGLLTDIQIRDETYQNTPYKKLCLKIDDGSETVLIQMKLDSGYGRAFCGIIRNADLSLPIKIQPSYSEEPDGKKKTGMFISQNGTTLKWYYTANNPGDRPPVDKMTFGGKDHYDSSKQQDFYIHMLLNIIKPALPHAIVAGPPHQLDQKGTGSNIPDASQITEPIDDLPF